MNSSECTCRNLLAVPCGHSVTENAQSSRCPVTLVRHHSDCSRCPGGVPTSPWYSTGSAKSCGQHIHFRSLIHRPRSSSVHRRRLQVVDTDPHCAHRHLPPRDDDLRRRADHQPRASNVDPQHLPDRPAVVRPGHQPLRRVADRRGRARRAARCRPHLRRTWSTAGVRLHRTDAAQRTDPRRPRHAGSGAAERGASGAAGQRSPPERTRHPQRAAPDRAHCARGRSPATLVYVCAPASRCSSA